MAHHAILVGVGNGTRFQFAHRAKRRLHLGLHLFEKPIGETHPADVDGKAEIVVAQEIILKSLPERLGRHGMGVNSYWLIGVSSSSSSTLPGWFVRRRGRRTTNSYLFNGDPGSLLDSSKD